VGDLSEELLKAGLISKKQFKQAKHDERVKKTKVGHEGLEKEERKRRGEQERREASRRDKDRKRVRGEQTAVEEKVTRARLKDVVKNGAVKSGVNGNRRFYFLTRDGKIPFLELNDEAARGLQFGDLAIVQIPDLKLERFVLLPKRTAAQVKEIEPELVRFWNERR
jgi:hypothetical protein